MWETEKIENGLPIERWDGSYNGAPAPQDVYVWKCEAVFENGEIWQGMTDTRGTVKRIGNVTLLR